MSRSWPRTIPEALAAASEREVILVGQGGGRSDLHLPYPELLSTARRVAGALARRGLDPGERVLLALPTGEAFLTAFFGCQLAGIASAQMSPINGFPSPASFAERVGALGRAIAVRAVITTPQGAPGLAAALPDLDVLVPAELDAAAGEPPELDVGPDDLAFLQFTSGTTHAPRAVAISQRGLAANTEQIEAATAEEGEEQVVVSWLPMFHDMGLISVLWALFGDHRLCLLTPFGFMRNPASWLQTISRYRGTWSPAPTFAYRYAIDRIKDKALEGVDLSSWGSAVVGAEPIPPKVMRSFQRRFASYGLGQATLTPAYGMAEMTLAVSNKPRGTEWRTLRVSREGLRRMRAVDPSDEADAIELTACGVPLGQTTMRIVGPAGESLPERHLGEIALRGPQRMVGYWGEGAGLIDGEHRSGDVGFIAAGQVYITGRTKDVIIIRGENHHPEEIEWPIAQLPGIRAGKVAAFGLRDPRTETESLCVMAEIDRRRAPDPDLLERTIRRRVQEATGLTLDRVELVPPRTIATTTSNKIRRAASREVLERILAERAAG